MSASHSKRTRTAKEDDRSCDDGAQPRIQAFPPEVLSEIFLIASHSVSKDEWFARSAPRLPYEETVYIEPSLYRLPCTLTRVCKSWRRAALTTPTLWSQFYVELGKGGKGLGPDAVYYREAVLRMASTWIRLSRNSPLYVSISVYEDPRLPEFLLESMSRWRGLQLCDDTGFFDGILGDILPDGAEDLQQLDLFSVPGNICLSNFPNVKHLSGDRTLKIIPEPDVRCQIKYLRASWRPEDSLQIMASLPSLTTLIVDMSRSYDHPSTWMPPSHYSSLKQIISRTENLYFDGKGKGLISILSCTAFPAVCEAHFTIGSDRYTCEEIASPLQECFSYFFQECSSTLTRLNLKFWTWSGNEDIIKTLYHATSIIHLSLDLRTINNDMLHALEWCNSREDNLCPHLASLKISVSYISCPDEPSQLLEQLARTVRSRMEKNKSVRVEVSLELWQAQAAREFLSNNDELRSLQDQGVLKLDL